MSGPHECWLLGVQLPDVPRVMVRDWDYRAVPAGSLQERFAQGQYQSANGFRLFYDIIYTAEGFTTRRGNTHPWFGGYAGFDLGRLGASTYKGQGKIDLARTMIPELQVAVMDRLARLGYTVVMPSDVVERRYPIKDNGGPFKL